MKISDVTEELLRSIDIHTVLPQQEPFVMVGTLIRFSLDSSTTETRIKEDNLFVENGVFLPSGMMENIAQTCAARLGFYNKYILENDVKIGYIGAIRDYVVSGSAKVGDTLATTVDVIEEIFWMTLAQATVRCGGRVIATAQIKLAVGGASE